MKRPRDPHPLPQLWRVPPFEGWGLEDALSHAVLVPHQLGGPLHVLVGGLGLVPVELPQRGLGKLLLPLLLAIHAQRLRRLSQAVHLLEQRWVSLLLWLPLLLWLLLGLVVEGQGGPVLVAGRGRAGLHLQEGPPRLLGIKLAQRGIRKLLRLLLLAHHGHGLWLLHGSKVRF